MSNYVAPSCRAHCYCLGPYIRSEISRVASSYCLHRAGAALGCSATESPGGDPRREGLDAVITNSSHDTKGHSQCVGAAP